MQIHDELTDIFRQGFACLSRSALLPGREEALHPILFKLICFSGQRALGDIDFLCSLPCGFVEEVERANLLIDLLLRPECPLFDTRPLIRPFSLRLRFGPGISPVFRSNDDHAQSVPDPLSVYKDLR